MTQKIWVTICDIYEAHALLKLGLVISLNVSCYYIQDVLYKYSYISKG